MLKRPKFFVALVPVWGITTCRNGNNYWLDEDLINVISEQMGKGYVLLSAGLWQRSLKYNYIKKNEVVFADSGGFQYYFLTEGRKKEFYENRDKLYRFQVIVGDYVAGGDIPVGEELDIKRVEWYANLTKENIEYQFGLDKNLRNRFINVMHGQSRGSMELWYSRVKDFKSVGWAIGAKGSTLGYLLQMFFLMEKGELQGDKLLHFFAVSGKKNLNALLWCMDELGLMNIQVSSDSSSYSMGRFGAMFYDGEIISYEKIRSEKKELLLWNGRTVNDIPRLLRKELYRDLVFTSISHFTKWLQNDVLSLYYNKDDTLLKMIDRENLPSIVRSFKEGGLSQVLAEFGNMIVGESKERLVDGFKGRSGKVKETVIDNFKQSSLF